MLHGVLLAVEFDTSHGPVDIPLWLVTLGSIWIVGMLLAGVYLIVVIARREAIERVRGSREDWEREDHAVAVLFTAITWPLAPLFLVGWLCWRLTLRYFEWRYRESEPAPVTLPRSSS